MATHTKIETDTTITYTPIQGLAISSYVVIKDDSKLDIHVIVIGGNQTWQEFTQDLDRHI
jgi:hypothetical protein